MTRVHATHELHELSVAQKQFYATQGYLKDLPPVFDAAEMARLSTELKEIERLLLPGESLMTVRNWHIESRWLYEIAANPQILNYVEGILGPDFYMWGTHFFAKAPNSPDTVAWHQDAYYWPLSPHHTVTVWLAFTDVDVENGAMRVIPGTHDKGVITHRRKEGDSVLTLELEQGTFDESTAQALTLKAGQVTLHDDRMVHGSPANDSARWRIGLTMRYSGCDVRCDLARAPWFRAYMMRGVDTYRHNPQGEAPKARFARLPPDFYGEDERLARRSGRAALA
jgi:ectoine hydroxylase-related dioxygenase (phytanoyl-CoA dioxygenase family)